MFFPDHFYGIRGTIDKGLVLCERINPRYKITFFHAVLITKSDNFYLFVGTIRQP